MASITENIQRIRSELPKGVYLLAISKTFGVEEILEAYRAGQRDFGENRVQELEEKALELEKSCPEIRWHFVGKLQTNKVMKLIQIPQLFAIHSIDEVALIEKLIQKRDFVQSRPLNIFLQVNTSGEAEKNGFAPDLAEIQAAVEMVNETTGIYNFVGLMTMGKIRTENFEEDARKCFRMLRGLRDELKQFLEISSCHLSMGMSRDYQIALQEGSQWLRLGTRIFGERR